MIAPTPLRLQLSRRSGFNLQAASHAANGLPAVKVDRSTRLGNPYRSGAVLQSGPMAGTTIRDAAHAVEIFTAWMAEALAGRAIATMRCPNPPTAEAARGAVRALRGHNLACWCRICPAHRTGKPLAVNCPDCAPCHVDPLGRAVLACDELEPTA